VREDLESVFDQLPKYAYLMEIVLGNASAIGGYRFRIKSRMKESRPLQADVSSPHSYSGTSKIRN
jgi:hypothetical protein